MGRRGECQDATELGRSKRSENRTQGQCHGKPFSGGWVGEGGGEGGRGGGRSGGGYTVRKIFPVFHHNIIEFLKVFTSRFVPFPETRIETVLLIAVVLSLPLL